MRKIVKFNRAFLYCCLVALFCLPPKFFLTAQSAPPQGKPVTIAVKNSSLADILRQVSKKSELMIYFQDADLEGYNNVSIDVKNKPVENILHELLDARGFTWVDINKSTIAIKKKEDQSNSFDQQKFNGLDSTINVNGKVNDEKGNPIIGATVIVKGTRTGTTTGVDGAFILSGVKKNAVLVLSGIGFLTQEVGVRGKSFLGGIQLKTYVEQLDQTVVMAYGKTTKRLLTGNISTVKGMEMEKSPVNNPILAVAGRVPGVQITQASGFAGSGVDIVIQGVNSLQSGSAPYYVIDGVPYTQSLLTNLGDVLKKSGRGDGNGQINGSPLSYINPSDIESIDILKDADATAIYGSRAANGAILITTKRGKIGKMKLDINLQTGFGEVSRKVKLLNTQQYIIMRKEAIRNDNLQISPYDYDVNGTWDSTKNSDWQKELIGRRASYTDAQLNVSGGNINVHYFVGGSYHKETTVFPTSLADQKISMKFAIDGLSNDQKFQLNFSGTYLIDDNKLPNLDLTERAMILAPNMPNLRNKDGSLSFGTNSAGASTFTYNPLGILDALYLNKTKNLIGNGSITYKILDGLEIKSNFGYTNLQTDEIVTNPTMLYKPEFRKFYSRTANYGFNNISSWVAEPQVTYSKSFQSSSFNILIGATAQQNYSSRKLISGSGYANDLVLENLSAATSVSVSSNSTILSTYKYNALFFRVNYNLKNRYIINISGRRDGSSRFGPENRFHNFGAIGAAWLFTNESFIRSKQSLLSYGKLKASFGTTGNDQIGDYAYLSLYQNNNPGTPYRGGSALTIKRLFNPYLQWEETRKASIGLDLGLMQDKILVSGNYYRNRSSNLLVAAPLPATTGPALLNVNFPATVQNTGLEIAVNTTNIKGKIFLWQTSFNLTIPRNKLISFNNLENSIYSNDYVINEPINLVKVYRYNRVNPITGIYEFLDKENKVTNTPSSDPLNYNKIINPNPKYYGGLNNTFSFKGFTLDVLLQFVKQLGPNRPFSNPPGAGIYNNQTTVLDRWQKEDDIKSVQRYTTSNFELYNSFNYKYYSDAFWVNASYFRLKNISLSFNVSEKLLSKVKLHALQIYLSGQNLLTFTPYTGLDPESLSNFSLPPLRTLTLGIHITL